MTIFDSFFLAQLDVFAPFFAIIILMLFCFELSVSLRLLLRRQPALIPIQVRRNDDASDAYRPNDYR
ncbi:hypothetical protein Dpoa2040_002746 [Dickeya sp. CFBP 2040]|uniref:Uncharacterized protein n=1 Tax=Dickeya poaceiphila TaxID=568768 RepID=A0A5B8IBT0_9GAMM|nr:MULTISPECIES: hypothetical protein [Dickeya]NKI75453.1 hypothetical protein [Dickeya sp. CFBP 2040]QDX31048.1 hypothetical protein Dpoa569_0003015 [Dickeya poaceiphila]